MNIKPINGNIVCRFDPLPTLSGLIIPERYLIQEAEQAGEVDAYGINTDRRLINPQTITILSGDYAGEKAFVHYGAFEVKQRLNDTDFIIPDRMVLFLINSIRMAPGTYLGEEVFTKGERTASGIYTTPYAEQKEGVKVKLTHVPEGSIYAPGDTVITVDSFQYPLTFEGKKYIKLLEREIIGIDKDDHIIPTNGTLLIEYIPDADLQERLDENYRRKQRRDFIDKNYLHYSTAHANAEDPDLLDLPEPKTVKAKVLAGNAPEHTLSGVYPGSTIIVLRNFGCILSDGKWLVNMEVVQMKIID